LSRCQCDGCNSQFGARHAAKDLKRYHQNGPDATTRLLLDALKTQGLGDATLLDVGAGIDATAANIDVARQEAARQGHQEQVTFVRGDLVEVARGIPSADIVTLDRVICCYDNMEQLVTVSAAKATRLYGAVYPRERWVFKIWIAVENFVRRVRGNPFQTFIHPIDAIDGVLEREGLKRTWVRDTFGWRVAVYSRRSG
jgi:hypothetical protein